MTLAVALLLAPALVLLAPLLLGRYPGEELLERARRPAPGRRPRPASTAMPRRCERIPPRGGRLVSSSIAGRGPPAAATTTPFATKGTLP